MDDEEDRKITLLTFASKVNESCLKVLDDIRERVESGEVVDISVAYVLNNGGLGYTCSLGDDSIKLWSSMVHSERQFYTDYLQTVDIPMDEDS